MEAMLSSLIEYGVLGIIAYIFLRQSWAQQKMMIENFQMMLKEVVDRDDDNKILDTILQTIQTNNLNISKELVHIDERLEMDVNFRKMSIEMIESYNLLITAIKGALLAIRENNNVNYAELTMIHHLIEEGYLTNEQLEACKAKSATRDFKILDDMREVALPKAMKDDIPSNKEESK